MNKKLQRLVERYGIMNVAVLFGYSDTPVIKKWIERGVPGLRKEDFEDISSLPHKKLKEMIINRISKRIG